MDQLPGHNQAIIADKPLARSFHAALAVLRQREVGDARVPAVQRPFCLAVADDEAAGGHRCFLGGWVLFGLVEFIE